MKSILGIDLSLTGTGLALRTDSIIHAELQSSHVGGWYFKVIDTKACANKFERWRMIQETVTFWSHFADEVIIEGYGFASFSAVDLAEIGGIVRYSLWRNSHPVTEVAPATLKRFVCGKGNADKSLMLLEAYKLWGQSFEDHNLCDAFCLAQFGRALVPDPMQTLRQFQREVIEQFQLPKPAKKGRKTKMK